MMKNVRFGSPLSAEPDNESTVSGTTHFAGQTIDEGKGRVFPCEGCGADLTFHIGQQRLKCPFCGHEQVIEHPEGAAVVERDFRATLQRLREQRKARQTAEGPQPEQRREVRCNSCGGITVFIGSLASTECPYCGSPIQRDDAFTAEDRLPVDGVLPFLIDRKTAHQNLGRWIRSRWFAPNAFLRHGVQGKFNGVYLPYWTFDSLTTTRYAGQRGEHYWVTVGSGKNQRRVRRTRWYPASGSFQRFFDDVLVMASRGLPHKLVQQLEPWKLHKVQPFTPELLAGFLARTYEVELDAGFEEARQRIEEALTREVRRRIGGDEQRIDAMHTWYDALTYKHLLLPTWLLVYRFHEKPYQVLINASTGEVQGERPYSWVKISLAALAAVVVAGALWFFTSH